MSALSLEGLVKSEVKGSSAEQVHPSTQPAVNPAPCALAQSDKQPLATLSFGGIGEPVLAPELRVPDVLIPLPVAEVRWEGTLDPAFRVE